MLISGPCRNVEINISKVGLGDMLEGKKKDSHPVIFGLNNHSAGFGQELCENGSKARMTAALPEF